MVRLLLRSAGFLLVAVCFAALVVDGTRSIAAQQLLQFTFGDTAAWAGGTRFAAAMQAIGEAPALAQALARGLLAVPTWLVSGILGLLLLYAGRPPAPGIGFSPR